MLTPDSLNDKMGTFQLLLVLCWTAVFCLLLQPALSSDCEVCDLQQKLELSNNELSRCQERLQQLEKAGTAGSYLEKVCNWVSTPGREGKLVMKATVDALLGSTQLISEPLQPGEDATRQVQLTVTLSSEDLIKLRRFVLTDEGDVEEMQRILSASYSIGRPSCLGGWRWPDLAALFRHESFVVCQIVAVSLCVALALWRKVKVWRVVVALAVASVAWTWVHLYKVALSRKQATLRKLGAVPQGCLVEKQGWWGAVLGALGMAAAKDKRCEAYYEALMVDPFWEVTPLKVKNKAIVVAANKTYSAYRLYSYLSI